MKMKQMENVDAAIFSANEEFRFDIDEEFDIPMDLFRRSSNHCRVRFKKPFCNICERTALLVGVEPTIARMMHRR